MSKTPRWKVKKLPDGRWLAHHPNCPPRDHFCWRWLSFDSSACAVRTTLPAAYHHAAAGYRRDACANALAHQAYAPNAYDPGGPAEPPRRNHHGF